MHGQQNIKKNVQDSLIGINC